MACSAVEFFGAASCNIRSFVSSCRRCGRKGSDRPFHGFSLHLLVYLYFFFNRSALDFEGCMLVYVLSFGRGNTLDTTLLEALCLVRFCGPPPFNPPPQTYSNTRSGSWVFCLIHISCRFVVPLGQRSFVAECCGGEQVVVQGAGEASRSNNLILDTVWFI